MMVITMSDVLNAAICCNRNSYEGNEINFKANPMHFLG